MTIDDLVTAFRKGTLEIDCVEMVLTQAASDNPIVHKGMGAISQGPGDTLKFKFYSAETRNLTPLGSLRQSSAGLPGQLYGPSAFFNLSATSYDGTVWHAERIIPHYNWTIGHEPIVFGDLNSIHATQQLAEPRHSAQVHFFTQPELPHTSASKTEIDGRVITKRDTSRFSACGAEFVVRSREDAVIVEATSGSAMDADMHTRIQEALAFLTARPLIWRVAIRQQGSTQRIDLSSDFPKSRTIRLDPPISPGHPRFFEHGWGLFSRYLEYVIKATPHPYWNHCSYHLHNACEASANSMDAWALGLSVAVEGIAELIDFPQNENDKDLIAKFQKWILDQVLAHETFAPLWKRVDGALKSLGNTRADDRVVRLVATGHAREADLRAWRKLRNRQVHPKVIDLRNMTDRNYQQLFDRINKVTVLMYHLVFHLIGYEGPYVDYGTHGYPPSGYPLPVADGSAARDAGA